MPLICYYPFVILTFCIWLSVFLCCYIALVSLSILQLPTYYINYTFIISLHMVKRVSVSVFFKSCFKVQLSIIFSPLHLVLYLWKCAPHQDHKNVRGIMFKYLIASLPFPTPKTILSVYIPDFFFMCVCLQMLHRKSCGIRRI